MLSTIDRQKLMRQYGDEPALLVRTLSKWAPLLLIMLLLGLIAAGNGEDGAVDRSAMANAGDLIARVAPRDAEAHRKQVFEERRERFESSNRVQSEQVSELQ